MIIIMKQGASQDSIEYILHIIKQSGLTPHLSVGDQIAMIRVTGDKTRLASRNLEIAPEVDRILSVTESYKLANKKNYKQPTIVRVGNAAIGGDEMIMISGPCAIESREQLIETARAIKKAGASILRGGAYKPRTSPYSFQGLEEEGLQYLKEASQATGLATICEVTSLKAIEAAVKYVDMLQIGARNMQNFYLLKEAGKTGLPILLKRGLAATIDDWLNAAEYILAEGNPNVVLCERGIRTFETATRNTLDLSAVPVIKEKSHLPIIVDPSHATGVKAYIEPLAKASIAAGADGLMIETHSNPTVSLSDGPQALTLSEFSTLCDELRPYALLANKPLL